MATIESLLRAQENLAQYIANFYKNSTEKVRGDLQTASHFAARLELLESYWAKFTVNNDQLVCSEKDFASETYFANDGYGYIEAEYISAKARIRDLLATALPSGGPGEATPAGRSEIRIEQFSSLPSLALPKFSGKPSSPIQDFRCTTVTYGTASAPFLALRVMRQLAEDGRETHPEAAEALHHQLYVDDVFFGADSLEQALVRRDEIIDLLVSAGMRLGKWAASDPKLIDGLVSTSEDVVPLNVDEIVSTLGLKWLPGRDIFTFQFAARPTQVEITKRSILAEIARTFDPLGWLSPVLVPAKVLLQDLCLDGVDWDAPISATLEQRWTDFTAALPEVSCIRIKRWLSTREGEDWHLHGFADASKRAYATAIYVVLPGRASHLIVAKTKLAPTGVQTVPRLELCAAVLLARLARHLIDKLRFPPRKVYCWSDSKVVLDWIASHPSRWPTFVANRVSEVQTRLPGAHWNHVRTMDNSADCATRGLTPPELAKFSLWWYGPSWLIEEETSWPRLTEPGEVTASTAAVESTARPTIDAEDVCLSDFKKFSDFNKITRIVALCRRWRDRFSTGLSWRPSEDFCDELTEARFLCFKRMQAHHFSAELGGSEGKEALAQAKCACKVDPVYRQERSSARWWSSSSCAVVVQ